MKKEKISKIICFVCIILSVLFFSCSNDDNDQELKKPTIENLEIGYANNKKAIRGRDFHFNVDVVAASKIGLIKVAILPKKEQTYSSKWQLELVWDEFKDHRNTNVHKHFTIPKIAPEGLYDFVFTVHDQNGSVFELKEDFTIIDANSTAVDPIVDRDMIFRNDTMIYYMGTYNENPLKFKKGDVFIGRTQIKQIQGDGILYTALIKDKLNHSPETVAQLDFSKAIIISKVEHKGLGPASKISTLQNINGSWTGDSIVIGAEKDNQGNSINNAKSWESGKYNLVILYYNSTYKTSVFKSIPVSLEL